MKMVDENPSLREAIAEGVSITSLDEPAAEKEVEGEDPPDQGTDPDEDTSAAKKEEPKEKKGKKGKKPKRKSKRTRLKA